MSKGQEVGLAGLGGLLSQCIYLPLNLKPSIELEYINGKQLWKITKLVFIVSPALWLPFPSYNRASVIQYVFIGPGKTLKSSIPLC